MSTCIVMCTYRKGTPDQAHQLWGDLRVALWSLYAYVPKDIPIYVAWEGPAAPDNVPTGENFHYFERPKLPGLADAMNWLIEKTDTDSFIMVPDDCAFNQDTFRLMIEDLEALQNSEGTKVGLLGCRSNFVVGKQNIRNSNGGQLLPDLSAYDSEGFVFEIESVFPVIGWFDRVAYEKLNKFPTGLHWFGDNLYSWDLHQNGWRTYMSRAYVHHIGARGTKSDDGVTDQKLAAEGFKWLRENRPDFYATLQF